VLTPALRVSGHQADAAADLPDADLPDVDSPDTPESADAALQDNPEAFAPQDEPIDLELAHDPHDAGQDEAIEHSEMVEPAQDRADSGATESDWAEQAPTTDDPHHPTLSLSSDDGAAPDQMWQAVSDVDEPDAAPQAAEARGDLGAELSRLEDTIAEMEAAVADSGLEFEPEQGDSFPGKDLPDVSPLVDAFDGAEWPSEADEMAGDAADDSQPTKLQDAPADPEPVTNGAFFPESEVPAAGAAQDEGLDEAEWAEAGALD